MSLRRRRFLGAGLTLIMMTPSALGNDEGVQNPWQISSSEGLLQKRGLFKGEAIPEINWSSRDTYNFTWGLTGVDNVENYKFSEGIWASFGLLIALILIYRTVRASQHYTRRVASISSDLATHFFAQPVKGLRLFVEKHLLIAPLWKHRHNDPITGPLGLHFGTLPSRVHGIFLFGYILSNVLYCTLWLPWTGRNGPEGKLAEPTKAALIAEFRGRTGVMATVNVIPLFFCILRNNYVGDLVGVGFNTWNLYHRWIGRVVFLESHAHMIAWMVNKVNQSSWDEMNRTIAGSGFLLTGYLSIGALWLILITAIAPVRHVFYQTFLGIHQISVIIFLAGLWAHCYIDQLPHLLYVNIIICIWAFDRVHRIWTICYKNFSMADRSIRNIRCSVGKVQLFPHGENAVHLTVTIKNGWKYVPGTHAYIYIPRLSWTQSHPFSIAWSNPTPSNISLPLATVESLSTSTIDDKMLSNSPISAASSIIPHSDLTRTTKSTDLHFIIARRTGFTNTLYNSAHTANFIADRDLEKTSMGAKEFYVFVEGPYSNESYNFDSFTSVLFVAGGSGITHPLGHIRRLLAKSGERLTATKRIKLAWVIRNVCNVAWIANWLEELWRLDDERGVLEVEIYVTRPSIGQSMAEDEDGRIRFISGRPQADVLVAGMLQPGRGNGGVVGAVAVNVCGPGALTDNLRAACRSRMDEQRIEFSEESFTWS